MRLGLGLGVGNARSATPGFVPWVDLAGCQQWLEADAGVAASGGNVSAWADQSGNNNNATAVTAPTLNATGGPNSKPCVDFTGAQYMTHPLALTPPCTIVVLAKTTASTGFAGLGLWGFTGGHGGVSIFARLNTTGHWGSYQNAEAPSSQSLATFKKGVAIFGGYNSIDFRTNGGSADHVTSGSSAYGPETAPLLGAGARGSQTLTGSLVLVGAWDRALSTTECQQVENYIGSKYGV